MDIYIYDYIWMIWIIWIIWDCTDHPQIHINS